MAYNLKYQSVHYSVHRIPIKIQIFKRDYVGTVYTIRVQSTTIETNNQGYDAPVIGTNAKIRMLNSGNFTQYDDLLMSKEKEFRCKIWVNTSLLVFDGFSICDMNEQQFLPNAVISLNFTNYLKRLEDKTFTLPISATGRYSNMADLIHKSLDFVGLGNQIVFNSSLFEKNMQTGGVHTCLEQLFVDIDLFREDDGDQDDIYTILTKILPSLDARLYAYKDKWLIERIPDLENNLDWHVISEWDDTTPVPNTLTPSLVQYYNKQAGDFEYVDGQQTLQYVSGTHTLKLNIQDKRKETLLPNDWEVMRTMFESSATNWGPNLTVTLVQNWYYNTYIPFGLTAPIYGVKDIVKNVLSPYKGMTSSIQWTAFDLAYPDLPRSYIGYATTLFPAKKEGVIQDTSLQIAFKYYVETALYSYKRRVRLFVQLMSGDYAGYYLKEQDGAIVISNIRETISVEYIHETEGGTPLPWGTLDVSKEIIIPAEAFSLATKSVDVFIGIRPMYHEYQDGDAGIAINVTGDFKVTVGSDILKNEISYHVSDDFIKETTAEISACDVPDVSYANGLLIRTFESVRPFKKTSEWIDAKTSDDVDNSEYWDESAVESDWPGLPSDWYLDLVTRPLVDIIAANWYRRFSKTTRVLSSRVLSQKYFKLFSIFTDDNLQDNGANIKFLLTNYVWNLEDEMWDLELEEYNSDGVIINEE